MVSEVIAATATAPGRGGIGVVRVSGPCLDTYLRALVKRPVAARHATRADFHGGDGHVIDQGLILYFAAPHSYTGEDVLELQAHGGPVVLQLLLQRCIELGARIAEPGEFTKRAFLNGKLDLAQAESVADLIDASTAEAARCALRSLQGEFSQRIGALVQSVTELRILIEAAIDFPEEELDVLDVARTRAKLDRVRDQLALIFAASRQGNILREGIRVVIAGRPNVGKSILLNRLAGTELAIVTAIPGTTRDAIRGAVNISGVPIHLVDTAGLREPRDEIEKIGISRACVEIAEADVVFWVADITRPETRSLEDSVISSIPEQAAQIRIINKIDLVAEPVAAPDIGVSAKTGQGIDLLRAALLDAAGWSGSEGIYLARERHLHSLQLAATHLGRAAAHGSPQIELVAEELRLAHMALAAITGEFTADDLLGKIFSSFCIGK